MHDPRMPLRGADFMVTVAPITGGQGVDITEYCAGFSAYSCLDEPFMLVDILLSDQQDIISNIMGGNPSDYSATIGCKAANGQEIGGRFHIVRPNFATQTAPKKATVVSLLCKGQEHIYNESTRLTSTEYWWDQTNYCDLVKEIASYHCKIDLKGQATSIGEYNIIVPMMHPMQAISLINERAGAECGGAGLYAVYQKMVGSTTEYYYDDVVKLMQSGGETWKFSEHETNMGAESGGYRPIDELYVGGANQSPVLEKSVRSFQDAGSTTQQGYSSRSFVEMDFINKKYTASMNVNQNTKIGSLHTPIVTEITKYPVSRSLKGRVLYEPINGDETFYVPNKSAKTWSETKPIASALLSKRTTILTYGCPDVSTGDMVRLDIPSYNASPGRILDATHGGKYLVYAVKHNCDRNGDFSSELELIRDGGF